MRKIRSLVAVFVVVAMIGCVSTPTQMSPVNQAWFQYIQASGLYVDAMTALTAAHQMGVIPPDAWLQIQHGVFEVQTIESQVRAGIIAWNGLGPQPSSLSVAMTALQTIASGLAAYEAQVAPPVKLIPPPTIQVPVAAPKGR